ncbi:MAG: FAD-binding oxidoreductase [Pseudomonadota bacterium]|nr:FAD-binding oxidoreductase [Pseudomonadota bacterium]
MGQSPAPTLHTHAYWLDQLAPAPVTADTLPARCDVLVIGSGYTGLSAAIEAARGGREVVVIDTGVIGHGCSTRNGGQISTSIKPSLAKLTARFGAERARAIRGEGEKALQWIGDFIEGEGFDCDFRRVGRFHAAHTPDHYETLVRDAETMRRDEGIDSFVVPRAEQHSEMATDAYFGGVVFTRHCSVHPGKLHRGYVQTAQKAGATLVGQCAATGIEKTATGFRVSTQRGQITCRDLVLATNGYTGNLVPWLQRRVIPIGSYIIATEELPTALVDELFPKDRIASDTCKVIYYYRASPDRKRILFGGRVSASETDAAVSGPRLYHDMCRIFPQLRAYGLSHSWTGTVAYSFDELAHTGQRDGIHYAMNYCGSGVSMAGYLGMRIGQKILGKPEGQTALDGLPNPTRPFDRGKPWFLPAAVSYYRWLDAHQWKRALAA